MSSNLDKIKKLRQQYISTDYVYFRVGNDSLPESILERDKKGQNVVVVTFLC
jgi:hypothetical protein